MTSVRFLYFDLGSTLIDELPAMRVRARLTCERLAGLGMDLNEEDFLRRCFDRGRMDPKSPYHAALRDLLAIDSAERLPAVAVRYDHAFECLFDGVPAMLCGLARHYRLGVIANQSAGTEARLRSFGIRDYFEVVLSSAECGVAKPDPRIFAEAERRARCHGGELVMIGDRIDNDIQPARARGWQTVRVRQGFSKEQQPANAEERATIEIDHIADVPDALAALAKTQGGMIPINSLTSRCSNVGSTLILAATLAWAGATNLVHAHDAPPEAGTIVHRIAFGSCNSPLDATPVWDSVLNTFPDVWVWLGDTVYADSPRPSGSTAEARAREVLDRQVYLYERQNALPAYQHLRRRARILGTWDDHDFGMNDAGADFVGRAEAQQNFLDFYGEPDDSPRRNRPGVYASYRFGPPGRTVQIILLDTRSFRSPLRKGDLPEADWVEGIRGNYLPVADPKATVLGEDQWRWLEATFRQPADVRLIATSIQAIADDHRFEKWGNFPHERRRLFRLIRDTAAAGVIFISGDRHAGELSRLDPAREPDGAAIDPGYPLYDLTSSALTRSAPTTLAAQLGQRSPRAVVFNHEINRHRIGSVLGYNHFAMITFNWDAHTGAELVLALHSDQGTEMMRHRIHLADLRSGATPP